MSVRNVCESKYIGHTGQVVPDIYTFLNVTLLSHCFCSCIGRNMLGTLSGFDIFLKVRIYECSFDCVTRVNYNDIIKVTVVFGFAMLLSLYHFDWGVLYVL